MPAVRDEGICLRHWDWSETSQTVSFFGRSLGVIRGLAKGARRERGTFGGGIDLLTRGEFGAIIKNSTELATLTEWDLLETFPALRERLSRNRAAFYAADLVQRLLAPADPHPALYDALHLLLRALGTTGHTGDEPHSAPSSTESAEMALALLRFQWRLLEEVGLQPALEIGALSDHRTVWFDPIGGVFSETAPQRGWRVRRATVALLCAMRDACGASAVNGAPDAISGTAVTIHLSEQDAEAIDRANRLLAAYVREVVQCEPPTLRDLFGNLGVGSIRPARGSI